MIEVYRSYDGDWRVKLKFFIFFMFGVFVEGMGSLKFFYGFMYLERSFREERVEYSRENSWFFNFII